MISASAQLLKVSLSNKTPLFIGNCVKSLIPAESTGKTMVSFEYNSTKDTFVIGHDESFEKTSKSEKLEMHSSLPLEHGSSCPCEAMSLNPDVYSFSFENSNNYIRLSCSTLVIDAKNHILLTKRNKKLRSFPGAWVNPGGRLDSGESLNTCALRELKEEVGIEIEKKHDVNGDPRYFYAGKKCEVQPLMVYESVYPTLLDQGFPKAQYLIIFYYVKIDSEFPAIKVKIQDDEVEKGAWVCLESLMGNLERKTAGDFVEELLACNLIAGKTVKRDTLPFETFEGRYPNAINEGIGEGHLKAMRLYYERFLANAMNIEM